PSFRSTNVSGAHASIAAIRIASSNTGKRSPSLVSTSAMAGVIAVSRTSTTCVTVLLWSTPLLDIGQHPSGGFAHVQRRRGHIDPALLLPCRQRLPGQRR